MLSIQLGKAHEYTAVTLTLFKLCRSEFLKIVPIHLTMDQSDSAIWEACSHYNVLDIFMCQMEHKETSLLAAYVLMICWKHSESDWPYIYGSAGVTDRSDMWTSGNFGHVAQCIVGMLDKGWFVDAVGWIKGCRIFHGLMASGKLGVKACLEYCTDVLGPAELRRQVREFNLMDTLVQKLEAGKHHQVWMSLLCLEILGTSGKCLYVHTWLGYIREWRSTGVGVNCSWQHGLLCSLCNQIPSSAHSSVVWGHVAFLVSLDFHWRWQQVG